ncbi:MAG: enoyl-CoA hydratase/isomerase family protein [Pseudomonadota bacterium]
MSGEILESRAGLVGIATLNAPNRHNALTHGMIWELREVLERFALDPDLRVVILRAEGKNFCSGYSLTDLAEEGVGENPVVGLTDYMERFPLPVICALNGGVYGAGLDLALACDFRVGTPVAKAHVPAARIGAHYMHSSIGRTVTRIGSQAARRLYLRAETLTAETLQRCGFLDEVAPVEDLDATCEGMAAEIASLAPLSVQGMKQSILAASYREPDDGTAAAREAACFASTDHAEGMRALKEKRAPVFKGT